MSILAPNRSSRVSEKTRTYSNHHKGEQYQEPKGSRGSHGRGIYLPNIITTKDTSGTSNTSGSPSRKRLSFKRIGLGVLASKAFSVRPKPITHLPPILQPPDTPERAYRLSREVMKGDRFSPSIKGLSRETNQAITELRTEARRLLSLAEVLNEEASLVSDQVDRSALRQLARERDTYVRFIQSVEELVADYQTLVEGFKVDQSRYKIPDQEISAQLDNLEKTCHSLTQISSLFDGYAGKYNALIKAASTALVRKYFSSHSELSGSTIHHTKLPVLASRQGHQCWAKILPGTSRHAIGTQRFWKNYLKEDDFDCDEDRMVNLRNGMITIRSLKRFLRNHYVWEFSDPRVKSKLSPSF